jgi:type I restriction enzyme M protein
VLAVSKDKSAVGAALEFQLNKASGYTFYNKSPYDLKKASGDTSNLKANLLTYIDGFSPNVRDIFERYEFAAQLAKLDENDLLLLVTQKFAQVDLHPETVSNVEMGMIFEELIRKFAEASNETAGEHFTPRDVVRLIVNLLFANDDEVLSKPGVVRSVYDPTAGTGGMLSVADDYIRHLNPDARLTLSGQELNDESYAIAKADMLIKGQDIENLVLGNTLTNDGHMGKHFDYCLANPPFGVKWDKEKSFVENEHKSLGFVGRFGPGLPKITDGALLFLLHLISKMRSKDLGGGKIGIVLSASAFYNGDAGSGYSDIRKYLFENDLVEAIVGLPDSLFYNTGIPTYVWILTNNKSASRLGKVQLINANSHFERRRKALGEKRKVISEDHLKEICKLYSDFNETETSVILPNEAFGFKVMDYSFPLRGEFSCSETDKQRVLSSSRLKDIWGLALPELVIEFENLHRSDRNYQGIQVMLDNFALNNNLKISKTKTRNSIPEFVRVVMQGEIIRNSAGDVILDPRKTISEKIPLSRQWEDLLSADLRIIDPDVVPLFKTEKIGFEILWARIFAQSADHDALDQIDAEIKEIYKSLDVLGPHENV